MTVLLGQPALSGVNFDSRTKVLTVSGATTMKQSTDVFIQLKNNDVRTVVLYGQGGNFYSGLYMGRLFKKYDVTIVVPENTQCISACAFMALADKDLVLDGELLFHTPYLKKVDANKTALEIAQSFGEAYMDMSMYLTEMGASIQFGKQLLSRTNTCKFITINDSTQITKLLSAENTSEHIWVKNTITDNCELMRMLQNSSIEH